MIASTCHTSDPRQNQLLAALPNATWQRWRTQLTPVNLVAGQVLCDAAGTCGHVYFPTTAIVSLLHMTRDGAAAEIAVVGNDGLVGISMFMGGNATPSQAVVQSTGEGYRLCEAAVTSETNSAGPVLRLLLRYTQALIAQVSQMAVCNRYHSIDQQLCRRLLLGLDRSPSDELVMTQELVANLLGVRREGVTAAASKLQQAGVIRYSRGRIAVLDRDRLEQRACECYAVTRAEFERLLPAAIATRRTDSGNSMPMGRSLRDAALRRFDSRAISRSLETRAAVSEMVRPGPAPIRAVSPV